MKESPRRDGPPLRLRIKYATVDQFLVDYTENIRKGGSFVRTGKPLAPGTPLHLELEVAGVPVFIKFRGRVVWVNNPKGEWHRPNLPPGMGIIFIFPDESSRNLLETLVSRLERVPQAREKTISPEYLAELLKKLRPDIRRLVKRKIADGDLLGRQIHRILDDEENPKPAEVKDEQG